MKIGDKVKVIAMDLSTFASVGTIKNIDGKYVIVELEEPKTTCIYNINTLELIKEDNPTPTNDELYAAFQTIQSGCFHHDCEENCPFYSIFYNECIFASDPLPDITIKRKDQVERFID